MTSYDTNALAETSTAEDADTPDTTYTRRAKYLNRGATLSAVLVTVPFYVLWAFSRVLPYQLQLAVGFCIYVGFVLILVLLPLAVTATQQYRADVERQRRLDEEKAIESPLLKAHPELLELAKLLQLRQHGRDRDDRVRQWWRNLGIWLLGTLAGILLTLLLSRL